MRDYLLPHSDSHLAMPKKLAHIGMFLTVMIIGWSPFSGGSRMPTLMLAMMGGWLLLRRAPELINQLAVRRWTMVFLLLWVPMWLSLLHAYTTKTTLSTIAWFSLMYLAGLAMILLLQHLEYRTLLTRWLSWVMALWLVDSTVQYVLGVDLLGVPKTPEGRITGMFSDLHQGILMLAMLPPVFYYLQSQYRGFAHRYLAWALLLGVGVVVTLSGGRGYVYIYFIMLLLGVLRSQLGWKGWLAVLSVPLMLVMAFGLLNPQLAKYKLNNTQSILATEQSVFDRVNHALSYRLNLWETGLRMLQAEPITGIGSHNYKRAYAHYASRADDPFIARPTHSHNIYVEWLAETGIVGGLGLLTIVVLCVRWYRQAEIACQQQAWPYALALIAIYFPINTTQPMLVPWWFPVLMLLTCAYIASLNRRVHEPAG